MSWWNWKAFSLTLKPLVEICTCKRSSKQRHQGWDNYRVWRTAVLCCGCCWKTSKEEKCTRAVKKKKKTEPPYRKPKLWTTRKRLTSATTEERRDGFPLHPICSPSPDCSQNDLFFNKCSTAGGIQWRK